MPPDDSERMHVRVRRLLAPHPEPELVAGAVRVFQKAFNEDAVSGERYLRHYLTYPDFVGLVAIAHEDVVGVAYGTRSEPGQWWHDRVAQEVGADHPALQKAWVLTELAVLPEVQGLGIGSCLHDVVLRLQPYPRALLSTQVANRRARAFYEARGWQYLHPGFAFAEGQEPFLVMHRELDQNQNVAYPG